MSSNSDFQHSPLWARAQVMLLLLLQHLRPVSLQSQQHLKLQLRILNRSPIKKHEHIGG